MQQVLHPDLISCVCLRHSHLQLLLCAMLDDASLSTVACPAAETLRSDEEVEAAWEEGITLLNHRKVEKQVHLAVLSDYHVS